MGDYTFRNLKLIYAMQLKPSVEEPGNSEISNCVQIQIHVTSILITKKPFIDGLPRNWF